MSATITTGSPPSIPLCGEPLSPYASSGGRGDHDPAVGRLADQGRVERGEDLVAELDLERPTLVDGGDRGLAGAAVGQGELQDRGGARPDRVAVALLLDPGGALGDLEGRVDRDLRAPPRRRRTTLTRLAHALVLGWCSPDPHAVAREGQHRHCDDGAANRRHIPSISRSTRSSWERKGSLHSTVRWAWSFSFRCTQSTVKSRRRSWARLMKSPRSRARVVCGGTDLARKMPGRWSRA